jgi:hypothetical protein
MKIYTESVYVSTERTSIVRDLDINGTKVGFYVMVKKYIHRLYIP